MSDTLQAQDVVRAIQETLDGRWTKAQLGKWAFQAQLDDDSGNRPFEVSQWDELKDAIYRLMFMEEGQEFELEEAELRAMVKQLEDIPERDAH